MFVPAVTFVYLLIALAIVAYKHAEVTRDPEAMPACGHLRGWYVGAALWPFAFLLVTALVAILVIGTIIVETWER